MKKTLEQIAAFDPEVPEHWSTFRSRNGFLGKPAFFQNKRSGDIHVTVDGAIYDYTWMAGELTFVLREAPKPKNLEKPVFAVCVHTAPDDPEEGFTELFSPVCLTIKYAAIIMYHLAVFTNLINP